MLIGGFILLILGVVSLIYGFTQNNSVEAQFASIWHNGSTNPGTIFIIIGIIAVVLGFVLIVFGLYNSSAKNTTAGITMPAGKDSNNGWVCPKCAHVNPMLFSTCTQCNSPRFPSKQRWKCPKCGNMNSSLVRVCVSCGEKCPPNLNPTHEWQCPDCGRINAHYVGTCGCGHKKP